MYKIFCDSDRFAGYLGWLPNTAREARAVDRSDGVSKTEAMIIGQCYSDKHLGGGKMISIEDGGYYWVVVVKLAAMWPSH